MTPDTVPGALDELRDRMDVMEGTLLKIDENLQDNNKTTGEIKEVLDTMKGAWRFFEILSKIAGYLLVIGGAAVLVVAGIKGWVIGHPTK